MIKTTLENSFSLINTDNVMLNKYLGKVLLLRAVKMSYFLSFYNEGKSNFCLNKHSFDKVVGEWEKTRI